MTTRRTSKPRLPLIGAQLSTAGGFAPVPQRALDIGAEVVQIFNTNPRIWRPRIPSPQEIEVFRGGLLAHRLRLFFHSIYLINLASPDDVLRSRSMETLAVALTVGALSGAEGVVTHIGSHRGEAVDAERRVVGSIAEAVRLAEESLAARSVATLGLAAERYTTPIDPVPAGTPPSRRRVAQPDRAAPSDRVARSDPPLPALLLETGAGAGNTLGGRLEHLVTLLSLEEALGLGGELPLGICIDTAHLFAAGYPIHEEAGLQDFLDRLTSLGLLERVMLVHLNDSRTPFGVKRDEHENLGQGVIGYDALARVVRHPALAHIPFVLEVPGADGHGPDAVNIAVAKSMRGRQAAAR